MVEMSTLSDLDENWYVSFYGTANESKLFSSIFEASDWSKFQLCPIWMKMVSRDFMGLRIKATRQNLVKFQSFWNDVG